jgi:ADP-ribosylglycohydrolase
MSLLDRFHGCLAGLALGDALGMPTEMLTPEQITFEFGWVDHPVRAPAWHPHRELAAGQVTDDTSQALAVARAYTADGALSAKSVAAGLLGWAEEYADALPVVVGPSTRRALDRLRAGDDPRRSGRDGTTNGAAYRAIPVGLVCHDRPEQRLQQVVEACLPTHGTGVAISGAAAVAWAVAAALEAAPSVETILEAAKTGAELGGRQGNWAWGTRLEKRIDLAARLVAENSDPKRALEMLYGYVGVDVLVAESVAAAFGVVALAKGDPMLAVVYGANIGGDTDTIAALAGAVCGAWRGIGAFDRQMLAQLQKVNRFDLAGEAARLEALSNLRSPV